MDENCRLGNCIFKLGSYLHRGLRMPPKVIAPTIWACIIETPTHMKAYKNILPDWYKCCFLHNLSFLVFNLKIFLGVTIRPY